jgi:hypothetical protein
MGQIINRKLKSNNVCEKYLQCLGVKIKYLVKMSQTSFLYFHDTSALRSLFNTHVL